MEVADMPTDTSTARVPVPNGTPPLVPCLSHVDELVARYLTFAKKTQVGNGPFRIVISPDGTVLYTANANDNTVTPIRISTNIAEPAIPVGGFPNSAAITPDGKTLYVGNRSDATVTPIHIPTNTPGPPIPVGK